MDNRRQCSSAASSSPASNTQSTSAAHSTVITRQMLATEDRYFKAYLLYYCIYKSDLYYYIFYAIKRLKRSK